MNTTDMKHTPTPYRCFEHYSGWAIESKGEVVAQQIELGKDMGEADAKFIVTACNHHDSLVSLLKRARGPLAVQAHPDHNPQIFEIVQDIDNELKSLGHE